MRKKGLTQGRRDSSTEEGIGVRKEEDELGG